MGLELGDLPGCFVVEIGERQAWYFIGCCDNRSVRSCEIRLYVDAAWRRQSDEAGATAHELVRLAGLNGLTVLEARCHDDATPHLAFADGETLTIAGRANEDTVGEPWWSSPWSTL
jgi:hypothetical protein